MSSSVPIGTWLAKVQYAQTQGKLPNISCDDPIQPFHFAVMKDTVEKESEEIMVYQVSSFPEMKTLCCSFHAMRRGFKTIFNDEPDYLESNGFRAALRYNKVWKKLLILITCYKFPKSFLLGMMNRISGTLSALFEVPNRKSAQFAQQALICFSKNMNSVEGVQAALASYKMPQIKGRPNLAETDTILVEVGVSSLVSAACDDPAILGACALFVYGRIIYTTMNNENMWIAELLVANQKDTTEEYLTVDGRLFCVARHYNTVMVSITAPGRGLEICCKMQVVLMNLDAKNLIAKMQQSFAKVLPPQAALDVLVTNGPLKVSQPPFVIAPLFAQPNKILEINAIASMMYETCSNGTNRATVSFYVSDTKDMETFRLRFAKKGESMSFWVSPAKREADGEEAAAIPHMLAGIRN